MVVLFVRVLCLLVGVVYGDCFVDFVGYVVVVDFGWFVVVGVVLCYGVGCGVM